MSTRRHLLPVALLASVLPAQRSVLDQLPQDGVAAAFRSIAFGDEFTPIVLPGEGAIRGLAKVGDTLWVRRLDSLLGVDWPAKTLRQTVPAPANTSGLAADERFLYLLQGREVVVFDPLAGMAVRTVPLPTAWPPVAFAVHAGAVHLAEHSQVLQVDLRTGKATNGPRCSGHLLQWLTPDGARLVGGDGVDCMDLTAGKALRRWPGYLQHAVATWVDGKLLLAAECAKSRSERIELLGLLRLDTPPVRTFPLVVRGTGETLRCEFDGRTFGKLDALQTALRTLAADARVRVVGADGRSRPPRIEIIAQEGVLVRELKEVWQAVITSGLPDARCPAQEAWLRDQAANARAGGDGR